MNNWWRPDLFKEKIPYLQIRAATFSAIRAFFNQRGYLEVETPALQTAPCMEAHIQAFKVGDKYLHTSPEFAMKKLLVAGLPKIYQLARVYRHEEPSRLHTPEFTMLEWYQVGMSYTDLMQETIDLLRHVAMGKTYGACDPHKEWEKITVVDALKKYADINILDHLNDLDFLRAEAVHIGVYVSPHDDWENALLKIMMAKVEPELGKTVPSIIYDYPVSMAALSRAKPEDPRFAERFEVYVAGIELANAFGELTDAHIQRARFEAEVKLRKEIYSVDYPVDEDFINAIAHGLPACSGIAVGLDRLVMLLCGVADIRSVQAL